ncbi:sigma-70 family RNA polymerase sigma factor [Qiania dongpingensis]|uniref:Sigma-70 family RNA polymerase sigma factor n=2 Tax=Qiania dongpingensis TaxID=2763669 RepID=A0A7G9G5M6_9FIRM|nr:sigma-70 family RNA polymerase sigma factor [Qiania dongpingensis]
MSEGRWSMERSEELRLIKMAKKGNVDAFGRLYEEVYKDLYRFALFMLKEPHDAEDVVGDTVAAAFEGIRGLRHDEAFRGWIFRILANKSKRVLKHYAERPVFREFDAVAEAEEMQGGHDAGSSGAGQEDILDLRDAFQQLTEEDRLIVGLSFFGGYNSQEIAEMLRKKPGTVRSRQSRALARMRTHLSGSYGI